MADEVADAPPGRLERLLFYHRDGRRITPAAWHELYGGDLSRRIVVRTQIDGGRSICTLWNGMVDTKTRIRLYGTALLSGAQFVEWLGDYDTEADALLGHGDLVARVGGRFFCPVCWYASSNIEDLKYGFCGRCKTQTGPTWEQRFG
jgi:hypothetical protein